MAATILLLAALAILRGSSARGKVVPAIGDGVVAIVFATMASAATSRPFTAATFAAAVLIYIAIADGLKRAILREPASFADGSELIQVYFYPRFYVPFVGAAIVYGATALLALAPAVSFLLEPPVLRGWPAAAGAVASLLAAAAIARLYCRAPDHAAGLYRLATGDLRADSRRFGSAGAMALHAWVAKAQRPALQADAAVNLAPVRAPAHRPPLLLLQAESFFDARRLAADHPGICLPHFDALRRRAQLCGRLATDAWGGYTMRAEFAALTGLTRPQLGLDWVNPYHAFARVRIDSLAWRLRAAGYRTICVHPFHGRFYRRDLVMPRLGFERFLDIAAFAGIAAPDGTLDDEALAGAINGLFAEAAGPLFIFAITIANHGPWAPGGDAAAELAAYSAAIEATDRMIGRLAAAPWASRPGAMLGFYGDHLPILPRAYAQWGEPGRHTDYALAFTGMPAGEERDLDAAQLPGLIGGLLESLPARATTTQPCVSLPA